MIAADTKHGDKATRRVFTICRFPSYHWRWKKNTTKTKDIFSSNFQMIRLLKMKKSFRTLFWGVLRTITDSAWLSSRSIICPTNSEVDAINNTIMSIFPGDVKVYRSNDSVEENEHQYPIEFLNTLCLSGMPRATHTLQPIKARHHHTVA